MILIARMTIPAKQKPAYKEMPDNINHIFAMRRNEISEKQSNKPEGKFAEGLLYTEVILKALNIIAGQTVLDAGCGNGYMSKIFSGKVAQSGKVYTLDSEKYFLKSLKNQLRGTNIEAIEGDITGPTGLEQSSIDIIYMSTVVHIFSKQQMNGFIHEAKRLLKPDALLAIVEIEKKETPFGPPSKLRYSSGEL